MCVCVYVYVCVCIYKIECQKNIMTFLRGRLGSIGGSRCSALPAEGSCTEAVAKGCEKGFEGV